MRQRVVGYVRVSTQEQVEGFGLTVQRKAIAEYCKTNDLRLVQTYSDEGISGSNGLDTRQGLTDLLAAAESPEISAIVVYRLDRLARDLLLQETMLVRLRAVGATVLSVSEPDVDSDDATRVLIRQVLGAVSQFERALIRSRMAAGKAAKAAQGGFTGGAPKLGYRSENRELVPDADEQAVLARIAELRADGLSLRAMAAVLDAEGLRPKRGGSWHAGNLARIVNRLSS